MTDSSTPIKLLFVSACPQGSGRIRFQDEYEQIKSLLSTSFEVISLRSASVKELHEALIEHRPTLFHFAGHGDEKEGALLLEGREGDPDPIRPDDLGKLFKTLYTHYKVPSTVVFNACYSLNAAQAIAPYVPLVIGMAGTLGDVEALAFANAFYHALRQGSWRLAFEMGCHAIRNLDQVLPQPLGQKVPQQSPWPSIPVHIAPPIGYYGPVPAIHLLTSAQCNMLIDLLASRYVSFEQRETLLSEAFYDADPHLYQSIDRPDSPRDFAIRLVQKLESQGHLPSGELASVALLDVVREGVDTEWQAQIDDWRHHLGVPRMGASRRELEIAYLEQRLAVREVGYIALAGQGQVRKRVEVRTRFIHLPPELTDLQSWTTDTFRPVETEQRALEDIVEGMVQQRRAVLLGDPGAGKTTSLRKLEVDAIGRAFADGEAPVPLFVPLSQWFEANESLEAFMAGRLGPLGDYLGALLRENRVLLLLDGLNEIPVEQQPDKVKQVQDLLRTHLGLKVFVTCRQEDYGPNLDLGLDRWMIAPLDPPRIWEFLRRYLGEKEGEAFFWELAGEKETRDVLKSKFEKLWDEAGVFRAGAWQIEEGREGALFQHVLNEMTQARFFSLARNPYLLMMLVIVKESIGELPKNSSALIQMFVDTLLGREGLASRNEAGTMMFSEEGRQLLAALTTLAYTMQAQRVNGGERGQQTVTALQREAIFPRLLSEQQGYLARCTSLLEGEAVISFSHQLLQEYFAACYLRAKIQAGGLQADLIWVPERWWERTGWEETIILLAGLYSDNCTPLLDWVEEANPEVAAQCLARSGAAVSDETKERLQTHWLQRLTTVEIEPDPRARAAVGRALALAELDILYRTWVRG